MVPMPEAVDHSNTAFHRTFERQHRQHRHIRNGSSSSPCISRFCSQEFSLSAPPANQVDTRGVRQHQEKRSKLAQPHYCLRQKQGGRVLPKTRLTNASANAVPEPEAANHSDMAPVVAPLAPLAPRQHRQHRQSSDGTSPCLVRCRFPELTFPAPSSHEISIGCLTYHSSTLRRRGPNLRSRRVGGQRGRLAGDFAGMYNDFRKLISVPQIEEIGEMWWKNGQSKDTAVSSSTQHCVSSAWCS